MKAAARMGWLEIKLLLREPLTLVFSLALPLIFLLVLGGVFGDTPTPPGEEVVYRGLGPMSYYVPAYLALVAASVSMVNLPSQMAGYRERGVLRRYEAAAVRPATLAVAQLIVAMALTTACAIVVIITATIAYDYTGPESIAATVGTFYIVTAGFTAIGWLLSSLIPTARAAQALGLLLWFVMMMLGGSGPPREVLDGAMGVVADAMPLWYAVQMMHHAWFGLDPGAAWFVFIGTATAGAIAGTRLFRWE